MGLTPGRSMQREIAGQYNSTAFQIGEAFQQRVCRDFMVSHLPGQGNQAKEGSRKAAEGGRVGIQAAEPQPCLEPQIPEMDSAPHIWLARAAPALGRQPSYTPILKNAVPLPTTQVSHVPHVSQMQGKNGPTGTPPEASNHCVSRAAFQGAKSTDKEKSILKNVTQITRIKQALSKPHKPLEPGLSLDPGELGSASLHTWQGSVRG